MRSCKKLSLRIGGRRNMFHLRDERVPFSQTKMQILEGLFHLMAGNPNQETKGLPRKFLKTMESVETSAEGVEMARRGFLLETYDSWCLFSQLRRHQIFLRL